MLFPANASDTLHQQLAIIFVDCRMHKGRKPHTRVRWHCNESILCAAQLGSSHC